MSGVVRLSEDWCLHIVAPGVDIEAPGLYEWRIAYDLGRNYIGQAERFGRRKNNYRDNVEDLLAGKPYHIRNRDYRPIHYALAWAVRAGERISLTILENAPLGHQLNAREATLIAERGTLNRSRGRAWLARQCAR